MADNYWRTVAGVLTATTVAQAIPIVGALAIARLYLPEQFGLFSAWLGMVVLAALVLTARLDMSLALAGDGVPRQEAMTATLLTILIGAILLAGFTVIVCWISPYWLQRASPISVLIFTPCAVLMAMVQTWQSWAAAEGRFRDLAILRIAQAGTVTGLQILGGVVSPSSDTMALAQLAGLSVVLIVSVAVMPLSWGNGYAPVKLLTDFWSRYRRFPLLALPADSINTAAAQLPLLIVTARFGADIAGLLALAMRTVGAPIGILGKAVLDVFKRHASVSFRATGECRHDYLRTFRVLSLAALAMVIVLYPISENLFAFFFGETWRGAGIVAIWLLPMFALRFVASPLSYMFYLAEQQHQDLIWQIALLMLTVMSLTLPNSYRMALLTYSFGYTLLYIIYLVLTYRMSKGYTKK